ncbi:phosphopantetheine-binding protein [Sulfurovum lithotrophicum]|uniref:Phosphopantetheine-binding protein n=1 Tax=Sulfurovum lithotrophicum TaxID=206403 RepID=A0A7U4RQV5_9BACT|nr:acyl carrier protein [Sulfurovum lithotrophicum]AKF25132.1 phosphopantetheine-binding protein [Sulfurovum lithotrophicum]
MTKDEIKKKIIEEIYEIAPEHEGETIPEDENIQRSLEIDSFDFLNLLTALNDELGVEVPESDYGEVDTVEHMADYFAKRLSK